MTMLEDTIEITAADAERYLNHRSRRVAELGPFPTATRVRVRAYAVHVGNGDNTASLRLMYDGHRYGEASDRNFNRADLQVLNHTIVEKDRRVTFSIESANEHGTREIYYGMEFWLTQA